MATYLAMLSLAPFLLLLCGFSSSCGSPLQDDFSSCSLCSLWYVTLYSIDRANCYCCCLMLTLCMPHPLLGIYGDVMRVKILYNKRDSTLIQFREPQQAQNCEYYYCYYVPSIMAALSQLLTISMAPCCMARRCMLLSLNTLKSRCPSLAVT